MSKQSDIEDEVASEEELAEPMAGERLAEARRELQIPVLEIAKELHLDEFKVRALESNDFELLGAPVFAKGHLKKYAQLVNVAEADVMTDYYELTRSVGAPPVVPARARMRKDFSPGPWVAGILVIAATGAAYWWFAVREVAIDRPAVGEVASLPQSEAVNDAIDDDGADDDVAEGDSAEVDVVPQQADSAADESVDDATAAQPEPAQAEPPTPQPVADDSGDMTMSIRFSGDCWTEITDASGRRLFFALGEAGRTVDLSGEAPFNVLFGDAANVSLVVNGAAFEIPAANRRGRTARLTITGS